MEWCAADIFKIINLYRQSECLWNFKSSNYKRTDLKNKAWQEIAKEMTKNVDEVKKKIKNLRTAYISEKKKLKAAKNLVRRQEKFMNLAYFIILKWAFWILLWF